MSRLEKNIENLPIPDLTILHWQKICNVLEKTMQVSSVIIIYREQHRYNFLVASHNFHFPHDDIENILITLGKTDFSDQITGRDAVVLKSANGIPISALPLLDPKDVVFGILCVIDIKAEQKIEKNDELLDYFLRSIENDIAELIGKKRATSGDVLQPTRAASTSNNSVYTFDENATDKQENSYNAASLEKLLSVYQEQSNRTFLNSFSDGILLLNHEGLILDANRWAEDIFGLQYDSNNRQFSLNPHIHVIIEPNKKILLGDFLFTALKKSDESTFQKIGVLHPEEQIRWIDLKIISLQARLQDPGWNLIVIHDISSFIQTQDKLAWLENNLKTTQMLAHLGSWELLIRPRKMHWSDEMFHLYGYKPGEISPSLEKLYQNVVPTNRHLLETAMKQAMTEGESFSLEIGIHDKKNNLKYILAKTDIELNDRGKPTRLIGSFLDITERKVAEKALQDSKEQLRLKLDSILSPDVDISEQDLSNIIDTNAVQSMMEDFTKLTGFVTALLDIKGKIIVATGWQDICTLFHRAHPESALNCTESDLYLASNTRMGEYVAYKCKNQLWDIVTPLYIGNKHVGNIYTGQFFYEDEKVIIETFEKQAERYGFNKDAYLAALNKVPKISRENAKILMDFLTKFSDLVSRLGYSNLKLAKAINEQKQIEQALRESERHFRDLTNQSPMPIVIINEDGKIEYINEKFVTNFGYTYDDIPDITSWWTKAYPDESSRNKVIALYQKNTVSDSRNSTADIQPLEIKIVDKNGSLFDVEIFGTRIGTKFLFLLNDITERKRMEETIIQREKLVGIGTLAAGITHEMNSPLQVITGVAEGGKRLMESETIDQQDILRRFNLISSNAWRLARIVRSLLDYAHSTPAANALPSSLNDLIHQTLTLTEHQFKSWSNITIVTNLDEDLPNTVFDANQMTQVIINLLTNARDAMPDGGEITINTGYDSEQEVIILRISDTGQGIPEDIQNKIFDPFFTTKPIGKGTGLGLSIIAGFIRGHHGEIELEGTGKIGTTFKITLPVTHSMSPLNQNQQYGRY